jgi:glycogen operon protein
MLLGGDEFFRTQRGNNNAYCQDNEIGWFDWGEVERHGDIVTFFKKAIALTKRYPVLQSRKFFTGVDSNGNGIPDIQWFGTNLDEPAWSDPELRTLCYLMDGGEDPSGAGDYALFIILNSDFRPQFVRLLGLPGGKAWLRIIDTSLPVGGDFLDEGKEVPIDPPEQYMVSPRSTVVLLGK